MTEDLEEQSTGTLDLQQYLGVVRRRHFHFLIPLFIGWALVWGASWTLAPRYQSNTLILVEQPTMPKNYVTPNINDDLQERLQTITQQILSRTRLLHIIDQFGLYGSDHGQRPADDKVELMRKDIAIDLVRGPGDQISSFNVSYTSRDPHLAQKITGEITNLFINENLEVRQQQSEDTTKFLESQLEAARQNLAQQEDRISRFKGQHVGEMPGQLASNLQILSGLQSQLQSSEDALSTARQQHVYLQSLADQYRALQGSAKSPGGTDIGLPALDQELDRLRKQLTDLSSRYTDRHPDVRKVKEQIAETEKMRDQLLTRLKTKGSDSTNGGDTTGSVDQNDDPSQAGMSPQIESQLRSNQLEITNRERSIAALRAKIDEYQARLNQEPIREQQLADLTRGYEQSKANYDDLLKKKNESAMATSMELLQQGERFRIMDPPSFPQRPQFPNRLKFCGMGLGIGLVLGVVVAGVFEFMDDRLYSAKEIRKLLPADVIGEIPAIVNGADSKIASTDTVVRLGDGNNCAGCHTGRFGIQLPARLTLPMYKRFYNLKRNPFDITPDPSFLFPTRKHNEALAALYYGVKRRKGFVVLTGEVGTGKTVLVRCLLQILNRANVAFAYVFNPRLSAMEFLQYVVADLHLPTAGKSKSELLIELSNYAIDRHHKGLTTVLVVDEAHHLSADVLEEIRLLTNLETGEAKLLQILLAGQPELDEKLDSVDLRQLKQRIALRSRLDALSLEETCGYVLPPPEYRRQ